MVKFAREHMQQGHFSLMWKDSAFNFAYFLWFEDMAVSHLKTFCTTLAISLLFKMASFIEGNVHSSEVSGIVTMGRVPTPSTPGHNVWRLLQV